ncbi:MAG: alpha/beta hydrolase fold protein [Aeromicrobium sp.]|nr:alpha/beta hydrolase fold protein [Aeromicrobium sp.]
MADERSQLVTLRDGATIWTTITGIGPPVVCCHGGPGLWDYLGSLASLIDDSSTVIRFDQRGCGRSNETGSPFTIDQAVDDLEQLRAALGFEQWAVLGHSWGAELAIRYAGKHPDRCTSIVYIAGVGVGDGFREPFGVEYQRRLGDDLVRWTTLRERTRTAAEEHEFCLLQWRPDFSPSTDVTSHAEAMWRTRPPGVKVNLRANRELSADRVTEDLHTLARRVTSPVTMIFGADDPRPWRSSDSLFAELQDPRRVVLTDAGHSPWAEQPVECRKAVRAALSG